MARVTVEDCINKVDNRFDLVLLAAHRVKQISKGSHVTLNRENDKNSVLSLREIASSTISTSDLKEDLIHSMQKQVEVEDDIEAAKPQLLADASSATDSSLSQKVNDGSFESLSEEDLLDSMVKISSNGKSDSD